MMKFLGLLASFTGALLSADLATFRTLAELWRHVFRPAL